MNRRTFCGALAGSAVSLAAAEKNTIYATERCVTEWSFISSKKHADPFNDLTLDVLVQAPNGATQRVPHSGRARANGE